MSLKIAMVGSGRIAETKLLPAIVAADGVELYSVLSRDIGRARSVAENYAAIANQPAHDDLRSLLADKALDAVLIATPDKLHAQQTIAAAEAGKHVLVEKPMATSGAEARAMVSACHQNGVKLGVAYHLRWHGAHRPLFEDVRRGEFGVIRHMRVQWSSQAHDASNWRAATDVGKWWSLAGVGTHCLDQVLWFMSAECGPVVDVKSVISRSVWGGPNDETALLALRFENGATADICSSVQFAAPSRFELYGSMGYAVGEGTVGTTGEGAMSVNGTERKYGYADCYRAELEDFAASVRDNRPPEVTGEMGLMNVDILCQATGQQE
ncbi:MAG: Gfo/Idh/MocA family protein [Hyphomicrobiaceae bacterium]